MFRDRRFVALAFILLVLFWGSAFAIVDVGLRYAPPVLFAGMRTLLGGTVMILVALMWGESPRLVSEWRAYLWLALFNVVLFIGAQTFTILYLPSGSAAVLVYLQPILVGLMAWLILDESLTVAKVVGLLMGFGGILAVSAGSLSGDLPLVGVIFGVASALFWALGTVYSKRVQERVDLLWSVAAPFFCGGLMLTVAGLLVEQPGSVQWTGPFVASWLYTGLIGTGGAWALYFGLVRAGEASRVASYVFFVPLTAVVIGAVLLGELLSLSLLAGAVLVILGIYLVNRRPRGPAKDR